MSETIFSKGFIFKRPSENAPDFVKGKMSVKVSEAIEFLKEHQNNDWVNMDLLVSKDGTKLYFKLDTFKKEEKKETVENPFTKAVDYPEEDINPEDIPFNNNL